jgi:hypothetical protein
LLELIVGGISQRTGQPVVDLHIVIGVIDVSVSDELVVGIRIEMMDGDGIDETHAAADGALGIAGLDDTAHQPLIGSARGAIAVPSIRGGERNGDRRGPPASIRDAVIGKQRNAGQVRKIRAARIGPISGNAIDVVAQVVPISLRDDAGELIGADDADIFAITAEEINADFQQRSVGGSRKCGEGQQRRREEATGVHRKGRTRGSGSGTGGRTA